MHGSWDQIETMLGSLFSIEEVLGACVCCIEWLGHAHGKLHIAPSICMHNQYTELLLELELVVAPC